ncbi:MAG: hypothetical protein J0G30_04515 [Actinomycetales bacterium]|nr:hypothetical protein [Actinomycetales bacterium]
MLAATAATAAAATLVTLAVVAGGYDAQEVPPLEPAVWVTRDAGQYARVNTEVGEIDTVRSVDDPSGVVQFGAQSVLFTHGYGQAWPIDPARPLDVLGSAAESGAPGVAVGAPTPTGTRAVVSAGSWVVYLTDLGTVYVADLREGAATGPRLVDPFRDVEVVEGREPPSYRASAVAVDDAGRLALYSAAEGAVRRYDAARDAFTGVDEVTSAPEAEARVELTLVGGRWVLSDPVAGRLVVEGRSDPIATGLGPDAVLQSGAASGDRVLLADSGALLAVDLGSGRSERLADGAGVPARPVVVAGVPTAAWVGPDRGVLWTAEGGAVPLEVPAGTLDEVDAIRPEIRSNGDRAVLNETASGLLWSIPTGELIPVDEWAIDDTAPRETGTVEVDDVAEQEPPVAVADAFGVRAGALVMLPLLLNDHDPNKKDVLTIDGGSVAGLDPSFGELSLAADDQQAVVRVRAGAGSASFVYAATDGIADSPPVTVTLTVVPDEQNAPPEWCGVEACRQEWPAPAIAPGGAVTVPVLPGWVDPDGDPFVLSDASPVDPDAPVTVVATGDGRIVVRHQDPNAADELIPIAVTMTDARGASATKTLDLRVQSTPALVAEPVAAIVGVGQTAAVDVLAHVRGGSGSFRVVDAVLSSAGAGITVAPNASSGRVDLTADRPGDYAISYTVEDGLTQARQSALLRVTAVGPGAPLAIAPLTAFVRAGEDTTVDVLAAVQNTSGRVLLVAQAASDDPALSVDVVGQSRVRVSGTTADGAPGRVGTASFTVVDGAGAQVVGELTVFLVAATTGVDPITIPDTALVRAGEQADLPVLANDVSPRGERLVLHPTLTGSGAPGELAFVAGDRIRYLAPPDPGVYTLRYSAYLENAPERLDAATVTVTVLPSGGNRPPQPPLLSGRVLSGQSVSIAVPSSGIDPDGDRVVLADVDQPPAGGGVAAISAEGDAIVYTAPGDGVSGGQISFGYTVRDSEGATATGRVRVGVLDARASDVAPVTYSDYIRAQVGSASPVTVMPTLNDRDPLQGALQLVSIEPNAPAGSPEYARLAALLDADTDLDAGVVRVRPGDVLGTQSYVYTVYSTASFSTAQGLVVVAVAEDPAPDAPVVSDTVVTARTRGQLAEGIDVVTDRVQWATGNVDDLRLSVWGPQAESYRVDGRRIAGPFPAGGAIVPFALTGAGPDGPVTSYGFLRIPALDDLRLQLAGDAAPIEVPEEQSTRFAVRALLDLVPEDEIEIRDDAAFAVQRDAASCSAVSATRVEYTAGREAPWSDTCTVPVRLVGQSTWTLLGVPIAIAPKDPQAVLNPLSRTVAPGATETVDLLDELVSWEGGRVGDLAPLVFRTSHSGSAFLVTQNGGTVTVQARADARPGTREIVQVTTPGYGGLAAGISLVVGVAAPDAPRGAVFTQQCDVSAGPTCTVAVIGRAGQYDPFEGAPGSGLTLAGVGAAGAAGAAGTAGVTCSVATVTAANDREIVATWPPGPRPEGGTCVVPYTVADAQQRTGPGQLTLDVLGYPQPPATVTTVAYTGTSVTLSVPLGPAALAHPATTGVAIYENGAPVAASCAPGGASEYRCVVSGLVNGEQHRYTARAVNAIGESLDTSAHRTSAYAKPVVTGLVATSIFQPGTTSATTGVVRLAITAADDAQSYRILDGGSVVTTVSRTGATTTTNVSLSPGPHVLEVVPISRFSPPIAGSSEGDATSTSALAVGSPVPRAAGTVTATADSLTLDGVVFDANASPAPLSVTYYVWDSGSPTCTATASGDHVVTGAFATSTTPTVSGLPTNREFRMAACASAGFGAASSTAQDTFTFQAPPAPTGTLSYSVGTSPSRSGTTYRYADVAEPSLDNRPAGFTPLYSVDGGPLDTSLTLSAASAPSTVDVRYCTWLRGGWRCGPAAALAAATAPTIAQATFPSNVFGCTGTGDPSDVQISGAAAGSATVTVTPGPGGFGGPEWIYDLTWSGPFAALQPLTGVEC